MNVPPGYNQQPNVPPNYGPPQGGYAQPQGYTAMPQSGPYMPPPPPHGFRGATRQFFNPAAYRQPGTGAFGTSSLILSIVSIFLCGILSPISLLLGFAGLIGKKTHKGAALAGVIISIIPAAFWVLALTFGLHHAIYSEKYAAQAGGPVIAAIEEYKKDHDGKVPTTLDALVENGYLPSRWTAGLDDLDAPVRAAVEGKEWKEIFQYGPGTSSYAYTQPISRRSSPRRAKTGDHDWIDTSDDSEAGTDTPVVETTEKVYWLKFVGVDGVWGNSDDTDVKQNPEKKFDLGAFGRGNTDTLRTLTQTKRELQGTIKDLNSKITRYTTEIPKEQKRLKESEDKLKALIRDKRLQDLAAIKSDPVGKERLALIGETRTRINAYVAKLKQLQDQRDIISIQVERIEGQESMAKMAESREELAKLAELLKSAKGTLDKADDTSDFMGASEQQQAAEDWYKDNFDK